MCLVVLYVKRYPYSMFEKANTSRDFWLQGHVSKNEARHLATKFGSFCKDDQKVDALKSLSKGVKKDQLWHNVFYGNCGIYHPVYKYTSTQVHLLGT